MGRNSNTVRVPRAWVFMVIGAAVCGAALASVVMVNLLVPRLGKNEAARTLPVQNTRANEPPANRPDAPANTPAQPPPVKPPLPPGEAGKPPEEIPPPPPPHVEPPVRAALAVLDLPDGAAYKFKPAGGVWTEGTHATQLADGMRLRVASWQVKFELWRAQVIALAGCDFTLEGGKAGPKLVLNDGGLMCDGSLASGSWALLLPQQAIVFERALFAAQASPDAGQIELTTGSANWGEQGANGGDAPVLIRFGASVTTTALSDRRAAEIEESFRPIREVLMSWDFEGRQLPSFLGSQVAPGFRGSKGALYSKPDVAAIGDNGELRFLPAENTRIRLRVKTNARHVRISFIAGTGRLGETWSFTVSGHERDQWSLVELALSEFSGPFKEARPLPGQVCHTLQFRMRFDDTDDILPSERYLIIDDVEIFTPK